jgi:uncharacterized membrane protein
MKRAAVAALGLFAVSCIPLMVGVTTDSHRFQRYGNALVLHGQVPYRDYALEYPPGFIPLYSIPSLIAPHHHMTVFRFEMAIGWALVIVGLAFVAERAWQLFAVALVPLVLGPFILMRYDAWPTAAAVGAVAALVRGRTTLAFVLLAVGVELKVWPLLLLPLFLLYARRRRVFNTLVFSAIVIVPLIPFAIVGKANAYNAFVRQATRHLHLESLGGSLLLALGRPVRIFFDAGGWSVSGSGADAIGTLSGIAVVASVVIVAWLFARSSRTERDFLLAVVATVTLTTVVGKVFSPQFMLWIAPFAVLALPVAVSFAAALAMTRAYFPSRFYDLLDREHGTIALLAVRNALLLVTAAVALYVVWRRRVDPTRATAAYASSRG